MRGITRIERCGFKHRGRHRKVDLDADQIHQLERPHHKTTGLAQQGVDARHIGHPFGQQAQTFGVIRPRHAVDDEPRRIGRQHRHLAPGAGEGLHGRHQRRVGGHAADDFHQLHARGRVEKVPADETLRLRQLLRHRRHRDGRGVGGQHRLRPEHVFQLGKQRLFGLQLFDDGFHRQATAGQIGELLGHAQAGQGGVALGGGELAALHSASQIVGDAGQGAGGGAGLQVKQAHRVPGLGGHLGNAGAHAACTDHGHGRGGVQGNVQRNHRGTHLNGP